jgi:hypothetical protein
MELAETQFYVLVKNYALRIKLSKIKIILSVLFLINTHFTIGQVEKGETIFGIQVKGIIPTSILNAGDQTISNDSIDFTLISASGLSIGGVLRHNFTKMFTIETGIHYVSRKYSFNFKHNIQQIDDNSNVNLISYEVPVQWLLYIRLGEQFYMNTIFGVSVDFYPSDVTNTRDNYAYIMIRKSWINLALIASVGFEYRTKEAGYFYIGGSVHYPLSDIGTLRVSYFPDPSNTSNFVNLDQKINGIYLSVDVRYFFNKQEEKKKQNINRRE